MAISVQLLISINGGAYTAGAQRGVAPASTVALKAGVNGGLLNAIRYEIYEYPPGMPCPAGWSVDPTTVSAVSTGVYIFAPSNVTTPPPTFSTPPSGAQNWGWTMIRLVGNNNPAQINDDGTQNSQFVPSLVDEQGCVNVVSPVLGAEGVARGLTTQVDGLRAWVGPLMQSLRAMDSAASGASFSAGGDLAGSGISQTVTGLRGNPLSLVAPTAGQFLVENAGASGSAWTSLSGDVSASAVTPGLVTVTGIRGSSVPSPAAGFLQWTGAAFAWSTPSSSFTAGGDLGGTSTNQNVLAVHGASVPSAGGLTTGNVLQVVGSSALSYGAVNLGGGAGYVTGMLPAGNQAAQTMGGDVTGTTAASVVSKVNGATVPAAGALTPGNVLQVLSAGGLTYGTVNLSNPNSVSGSVGVAQGGTGLSAIGTADQLLGVNHAASALYYFTPGGDATLASGNFTVIGLQGFSVATTTPTTGQVLTWNAGTSKWTATTPGSGASVTGSGVWHSTTGALDSAASKGTAGQFLLTNAGASDTAWASLSGDVSASVSTVGQVTVTALQAHAVSSSAPTAGQFLIENAGASSWVPTSLSQDVSASLVTPGAITVVGIRTVSVPALASGYLQYTGSVFAWTTPANSSVTGSGVWHSAAGVLDAAASKGTAGQFLVTNAGATDTTWASLSADVTGSTGTPGAITVVAIRGNPVTVTAPTAGQVLVENAGATASAWTSFSGDVTLSTGTPGLATVVGLKGQTIPTLASGWLQWNGSALVWSTPPGAFTAGGDLSGTSSSQTVIGLQGRAVASTAPSNGQVLEWNNGASQWQPTSLPAGTSVTGSGFWHSSAGTLDGAASKGTAGQFAVTNAGATDATWVSISGDATNSTSTAGKLTVTGIQGNPVSGSAATAGQVLIENSGATGSAWTSFSGDVTLSTGTPGAATVVALQGHAVSSSAPTAGQFFIENAAATNWVPTSLSGDVSASTGTPGQITVTGLQTHAVPAPTSGALVWNGSALVWSAVATPFTAGGDLSGTATSQTVIGIQGNPVNATAATAGQLLIENSGATGSKWTTVTGDVAFSAGVPGSTSVIAIRGNAVSNTAPTAGQFLIENAGATSWVPTTISGDVSASTGTPGQLTVNALKGAAIPTLAAGFLQYTGSALQWGTALNQLTGDVTAGPGSGSQAATVVGIRSTAVPALAAGYLHYTGSAFVWDSVGVQQLVFQPGGTPGANVYTSWPALFTAAGGVAGALSVFFDGQFASNAATIPSGSWAFTNPSVEFTGGAGDVFNVTLAVHVTCAVGCTISGVTAISKILFDTVSSSPVFTYAANGSLRAAYTTTLQASGSAPLISVTGSAELLLDLFGYSLLGGNGNAVIHSTSSVASSVNLNDACTASASSITGNVGVGVIGAAAINNSGITPILLAVAANLGYNDALHSPALGSSNVQGAIDALKAGIAGGTITQLTGDVLAGPGSGSQVATVVKISGTSPIAITPNSLQWIQGATGPLLTQAQQANAAAPVNFTIAPQAPGASATNATNGTPGSVVVPLSTPVNGGNEPAFNVTVPTVGTPASAFQVQGVGSLGYGGVFWAGVGVGAPFGPPTINNAFLKVNANGSNGNVFFNALSTTAGIGFEFAGTLNHVVNAGGLRISGGNVILQPTPTFGGAVGYLAFNDAQTLPTSAPTNIGAMVYSNASALEVFASGIRYHCLASPTLSQNGATTDVPPQNLVITPQAPFSGATTTANKTPGSVVVNLPLPVSGGSDGTLAVQRNGTLAASIDAQGVMLLVNTSSSQSGHSNAATIWSATGGNLTLLPSTSDGLLLWSGDLTTSVAISTNLISMGGTTSCNVQVNGGGVGGGAGVVALKDANTVPTSVPSTAVAIYSHNVGGTSFLGVVGRGITFSAAMTAVTINQQGVAGAADGNPLVIAAQNAGAGGGNHNGGQLGLLGGQPSGAGAQGSVVLGTPDLTSGLVTASGTGVIIQSGGTSSNPAVALAAGAASGALALSVDGSGSLYVGHQLSYVVDGSINSQKATHRRYVKFGQLTTTGLSITTNFTVPAHSESTVRVTAQGRVILAGTGTSVDDTFSSVSYIQYRSNATTVARVGSIVPVFFGFPASLTSASGIGDGVIGTTVTIGFQMTTASGTLGTADATIWIDVYDN